MRINTCMQCDDSFNSNSLIPEEVIDSLCHPIFTYVCFTVF